MFSFFLKPHFQYWVCHKCREAYLEPFVKPQTNFVLISLHCFLKDVVQSYRSFRVDMTLSPQVLSSQFLMCIRELFYMHRTISVNKLFTLLLCTLAFFNASWVFFCVTGEVPILCLCYIFPIVWWLHGIPLYEDRLWGLSVYLFCFISLYFLKYLGRFQRPTWQPRI